MCLNSVFLTLYLGNQDSADLFSFNDGDFLGSLSAHSELILFDTSTSNLRLKVLHLTIIFSLHVSQLLILLILQSQFLVAVFLDVISKHVFALSLFFESLSQGLIDVDISDVAVFENDAEILKLLIQILDHFGSHFTLKIKDLAEPDAIDEYSDAFIDLSIEKLIETAGTETVHEILHLVLLTRHTEREIQINVDIGVVLSGAVVDLVNVKQA